MQTQSTKSFNMAACKVSYPPANPSLVGDYIGMESCLDLRNNEDVFASLSSSEKLEEGHHDQRRGSMRDQPCPWKEFPPPIPLLARTENLPSYMPWVLKRYYTSDGRLILREERVRHHEYFRAHRCNGRLTLHLVPLDHDATFVSSSNEVDEGEGGEEEEEEEEEGVQVIKNDDVDGGGGGRVESDNSVSVNDVESNTNIVDEEGGGGGLCDEDKKVPSMEMGRNGGSSSASGAGKCSNYNSVSVSTSSSRIFCVPVPAVRAVHS